MDALDFLKQDHQKVADLFERIEITRDEKGLQTLFEQIKSELEVHTHIEETLIYPEFEKQEELEKMILEAYEEHNQVKSLLLEIEILISNREQFDSKLKELKENVKHHVEVEEDEVFPEVKNHYAPEQLEELGREIAVAKVELGKTSRKISSAC